MILYSNHQLSFEFGDIQNQNWLLLCWRSFSDRGRECVALPFTYEAIQYLIHEW